MDSKIKNREQRRRAGFTLIEILLVVVIIGILAALAVPKLSGRVEQAKQAAVKKEIQSLGTALELYELDVGEYPSSLQGLIISGSGKGWKGPYIKSGKLPKDPWGNDYSYSKGGNGTYTLTSSGVKDTPAGN